jgi:glycosyltransferase involved in cell wall biosynthesis
METIILFDQDTQHYRQLLYKRFREDFARIGYNLVVVYDLKNNNIADEPDFFIGINYSLRNFIEQIRNYNPRIIIQFVWLKYKFLFLFMLYCKLIGVKSIVWSHGINMQKRTRSWKKYFYYIRQLLGSALIIYSPNERKFIVASHKKLFIANNTLNFRDFPVIQETKEQLKQKYGFPDQKIVLCVGRLNTHNRKVDLLCDAFKLITNEDIRLVIVGTGVSEDQQDRIRKMKNASYLGALFDPVIVNEIYKMSDIFVMPGGVGLAINHAFYHGLPVIIEDVNHSPEAYYLREGENGYLFKKGDPLDLRYKIITLFENDELYKQFSNNALQVIASEASYENMIKGFLGAIQYVKKKNRD